MRIKRFETTSPILSPIVFESDRPICFFAGAPAFLHMMRCLLDGEDDGNPIDENKTRTFVSRVDFENEGKDYELYGVLCDDKSFFVATRDGDHFSKENTSRCIKQLRAQSCDGRNFYCMGNRYYAYEDTMSAGDYYIANFKSFMDIVRRETENGDRRSIYIFNFFERLDEAVDVTPFIDELATLGRQVFVSVDINYPEEKMRSDKVQVVRAAC